MAFKKISQYNDERFGGMFVLRDDGEFADVIFMYRSADDCLVADTHYIKSADYSGYVHCCGKGCPACSQGIRVQTKLFIPLYNLTNKELQFWDRGIRFEHQLQAAVFDKYPNPCDYVFRITRRGAAGDVNTTYEIVAIARAPITYSDILTQNHVSFPEGYEKICRDLTPSELSRMLASKPSAGGSYDSEMPDYKITPRAGFVPAGVDTIPTPEFTEITDIPEAVFSAADEISETDLGRPVA